MLRLYKILLLTILFTTICSVRAYACGICAFALFDGFMPPILFWCILAVVWFLVISSIGSIYGIKKPKVMMSLGAAIIVTLIGLGGASFMLGPISILPLALPAVITTIFAIIDFGPFKQNKNARITILCVGGVIMLLAGFGLLWRKTILATRTDAKFYIQWSGTMAGRGLMAKFKQNEPASISEYRYIVDNGKGSAVADAARRLGIIGDPKIDKTRLKLSLPKVEDSYDIKAVQEAIDSLSAREADSTSNRIKK